VDFTCSNLFAALKWLYNYGTCSRIVYYPNRNFIHVDLQPKVKEKIFMISEHKGQYRTLIPEVTDTWESIRLM
jgi:hypothetical protein